MLLTRMLTRFDRTNEKVNSGKQVLSHGNLLGRVLACKLAGRPQPLPGFLGNPRTP